MSKKLARILLVGGGLTSAVCSWFLRNEFPEIIITVWEKTAMVGGRMNTTQSSGNASCSVDLGAQYISVTPQYLDLHKEVYEDLLESRVLVPLSCKIGGMRTSVEAMKHYVAPKGSSSIVKHFLEKSHCVIKLGHCLMCISGFGSPWEVCAESGAKAEFDVVVLTVPVPELFSLCGTMKALIDSDSLLLTCLRAVRYSSRFALGLFFKEGDTVELDLDCAAQYLTSDPIMCFVAVDNRKRNSGLVCAPSVVLHTSILFGEAHLDDTPEEVEPLLLEKVHQLFPLWPEPESIVCHKWTHSQVLNGYEPLPGAVKVGEGLVVGGDAFTQSNMDGCIKSATAITKQVSSFLRHSHAT